MRLRILLAAVAAGGALLTLWLFAGRMHTVARAQPTEPEQQLFLPVITHDHTPGWHWDTAYTVTVSTRTTEPPLAAIDRAGQPHLFWHNRTLDGQIHHLYLGETGWTELSPSQGLAGDSSPTAQPLVDLAGRVHLLWFQRMGSSESQPYRFQYATFDGERWSEPDEVIRLLSSTSKAWVRLDQNGQPHLGITTGFMNWRALLMVLQETWQPIGDFRLPSSASVIWPDAGAGAHLFGGDSTSIKYWRWFSENDALEDAQILGNGRLAGRSLVFDSADNLHMYWKASVNVGGAVTTLLHHQCVDAQQAISAVSYHGGPGSVRETVGAGEHGTLFALAWQESARKRIMLWDGCTPDAVATIPEDGQPATLLRAVTVSSAPRKVCAFLQQGNSATYTVRCAEIE